VLRYFGKKLKKRIEFFYSHQTTFDKITHKGITDQVFKLIKNKYFLLSISAFFENEKHDIS
jgi:hypothetical protein